MLTGTISRKFWQEWHDNSYRGMHVGHKLESRSLGDQQPQTCSWYHFKGRRQRGTKQPLDEGERGEWKSWLETQHSKKLSHDIQSHHFMANRWGNNGHNDRLYFPGLQNQMISHISNYMRTPFTVTYTYLNLLNIFLSLSLIPIPFLLFLFFLFFHISLFLCFL